MLWRRAKVGGVMIWEIGQDTDDSVLHQAIKLAIGSSKLKGDYANNAFAKDDL